MRANHFLSVGKLYIFALILTPTFFIGPTLGIRLDDVILFYYLITSGIYLKIWNYNYLIFLLCFMLIFFISLFSGVLLGYDASLSDISKLFWVIKSLSAYSLVIAIVKYCKNFSLKELFFQIIKFYVACSLISSIICIIQFFDLFSFNILYIQYIAPTQFESLTLETFSRRSIGFLSNPHDQAFILVIAFNGVLYLIKENRCGNKFLYMMCIFIILLGILTTISRTGILALISCTIFFLYGFVGRLYFIFSVVLIFVLGYCGIGLLEGDAILELNVFSSLLYSFAEILNFNDSQSFRIRFDKSWIDNIDAFTSYPIFGIGFLPRDISFSAPDGDYFYIARSLGVFGIASFLIFHLTVIFNSSKLNYVSTGINNFILLLSFTCLTFMINSSVITSPILFPLVVFFSSFILFKKSSLQKPCDPHEC